ncbi:hypothetical protein CRUP_029055, partial [Coryphaenoides rupestris]
AHLRERSTRPTSMKRRPDSSTRGTPAAAAMKDQPSSRLLLVHKGDAELLLGEPSSRGLLVLWRALVLRGGPLVLTARLTGGARDSGAGGGASWSGRRVPPGAACGGCRPGSAAGGRSNSKRQFLDRMRLMLSISSGSSGLLWERGSTLREGTMDHIHQFHQRLDGHPLYDQDTRVVDEEDEGEADGASQATVGDDELVPEGHRVPAQLVDHRPSAAGPLEGAAGGKRSLGPSPEALQSRQSSRVAQTKGQLHMCTSWMVDTPRKMKMRVSLTLLHIFRKY